MREYKHLTEQQLDGVRSRAKRFDKVVWGGSDGQAIEAAYASALDVPPLLAEVEALRERVAAAERVCVILGGLPPLDDSVRGKAALQAWLDWSAAYHRHAAGVSLQQEAELARRRDEIRAATVARFRAERGGTGA